VSPRGNAPTITTANNPKKMKSKTTPTQAENMGRDRDGDDDSVGDTVN
jgi:hypothetical protein